MVHVGNTLDDLFAVGELEVDESSGKDIYFMVIFEANDYFKWAVPPRDHVGSHWIFPYLLGKTKVNEFDV